MAVVLSSSLVLSAAGETALRYPRLCVDRITGTVTASGAESDFPASVAANPLTYSAWRADSLPATWQLDAGSAVTVDYVGIAGHDLAASGASVQVQYSTDAVSWSDATVEYMPGDTEPVCFLFEAVTARYWRVRVTGSTVPSIAVIQMGEAHVLPRGMRQGFGPGVWNREEEYNNVGSEGGQILGRSLRRRGTEQRIRVQHVPASWVEDNWVALLKAFRTSGVFFVWDPENHDTHVIYGMTERAPTATYSAPPNWIGLDIRLRGL